MDKINSLQLETLRDSFQKAEPFPFVCIENFLEESFAQKVSNSYPDFSASLKSGRAFESVNEHLKVQVTDYEKFPDPVKALADALAAPKAMEKIGYITGYPDLIWDPGFAGGGMHQTQSSGRLDVHVDFNILEKGNLLRRLNLLIYLNHKWESEWGGALELWDKDVKECHHTFVPKFNTCVIFETSDISYHGVTPVQCPESYTRNSFAVYYYTEPNRSDIVSHSTIFKARPYEYSKRYWSMPVERLRNGMSFQVRRVKNKIKTLVS